MAECRCLVVSLDQINEKHIDDLRTAIMMLHGVTAVRRTDKDSSDQVAKMNVSSALSLRLLELVEELNDGEL